MGSKMATERGGMRGHKRERVSEIEGREVRLRERGVENGTN